MNEKIIKSSQEIEAALIKLSVVLNKDFHKIPIDLVSINHAAKYLVEDLTKLLDMDVRSQSLNFENYESPSKSGEVCLIQDLEYPIFGRHVILADGIIISGTTHSYLINSLKQRLPRSISIVSVGIKPNSLRFELPNCYSLFKFNKEFVGGYGMGGDEYSLKKYLVDLKKSL